MLEGLLLSRTDGCVFLMKPQRCESATRPRLQRGCLISRSFKELAAKGLDHQRPPRPSRPVLSEGRASTRERAP